MARPRVLEREPAVRERILSSLRAGNYLETAASAAGVSPRLVRQWLQRGGAAARRDEDGLPVARKERVYLEFWQSAEAARSEAEERDVAHIARFARRDWRAAAWRLERRHAERWGRHATIEHGFAAETLDAGRALLRQAMGDDEARRHLDALASRLAGDADGDGGEAEQWALEGEAASSTD